MGYQQYWHYIFLVENLDQKQVLRFPLMLSIPIPLVPQTARSHNGAYVKLSITLLH